MSALALERVKYITAVVLYGTIGLFLRYVALPSELVAMCRGVIGAAAMGEIIPTKKLPDSGTEKRRE